MIPSKEYPVICWWSGGVTSAVACKIAIDTHGVENCLLLMLDTKNEDEDTERFRLDCEKWFGMSIGSLSAIPEKYESIQDVWYEALSLNVATGAICSSNLKREVRKDWQRKNKYSYQVWGYDASERDRADGMQKNYPSTRPLFPLLEFGYSKEDCINIVQAAGIEIPRMYRLGFRNNNCFKTGCVQGGIGYWQKMRREFPDKFNAMARAEHMLTDLKGQPVTCLKDQSNRAKESGIKLVFLLPHLDYPQYKDLSMFKPRRVEPAMECNGLCGIEDGKSKF